MSKSQTDTHLRYGQGILIKGYKKQSEGIMTAKGFADTRARFETYDDILYFKNYRNAIFQVLPASSFDLNDQLRFRIENNIENTGGNVQILKAKAKSESDQFDLIIKSKQKQNVCFGDQVVFKHIDSGTYLSGTIKPAQGKNGAFSVQVAKDLKTALVFKLLPYRSFENLTNPISLQSPILIQNIANKGFLTYQRLEQDKQKKQKQNLQRANIKSDQSYKIPIKTDSTTSQIFQCVTHFCDLSFKIFNDEQMPWKFQLHFNDVQNDNLIQHDIVYFQHTLNNGVLAASFDEQIILKQYKGQKTSQLQFYDCLWQIQQYKQAGDKSYILRHLMSGMILGVGTHKIGNYNLPSKPKLVDISDGKNKQIQNPIMDHIELRLAKKQGGDIGSKSYINICVDDKCLDIAKQKDKQRQISKQQAQQNALLYQSGIAKAQNQLKKGLIDTVKMSQMAYHQFSYEIKKLQFTDSISKHCFVIQQIDNQLKSQVLFALSFHSRLINLRQDLKLGAQQSQKKVSYLRMMQITQKTKQIKYFLKNTTIQDPNRQFKRPVLHRQIICLHLGISQLLFQLLFFMRKNRDGQLGLKDGKPSFGQKIFANKSNQLQKFIEMYNAIYQVIFQLIRDNIQFKIHISKWIMFIFQDVIQYNQQYHLKTLLELLKNNFFFVNNFVTQQLVAYLVQNMIHTNEKKNLFYQRKYIEIFRAFCICGDQVNSDNQVLILNKFIKKLSEVPQGNKYQIKLSKKKNEIQKTIQIVCTAACDKNTARQRKFCDYYKICRDQYPSAWQYMVSYLHLIADLCRGRNKTVQSYIDTTLPLDVLTQLITKQKLFDAQVPIIRIAHYLYAQSQNFYPIDTIHRISYFNDLDQQININSTTSIVRPIDYMGSIMKCVIQKLKTYGPIQVNNVSNNQCLYALLDFLKQTFMLGFWEEKLQVQQIYQSLSRLIQPQQGINYIEIRQQSQKPQIVLMISCKQKCIQILQFIINLDIDYYLKHLSRTFKQFQIPIKKIQIDLQSLLSVSQDSSFAANFIQKFKNQSKNQKPIISIEICPKIIELSKHGHPNLTSFSLKILEGILDFYKNIANGFINMIFICEQKRKQLHTFIAKNRDKFFTLQYQTTTKISQTNQKSLYFPMYRQQKQGGIMQDLYMISQLVKNENNSIKDVKSIQISGTFRQLAQKRLINFTSQRRSSNKMKQKVVDACNIHQKVLRYIFNCKQIPTQILALKLLHLCYKFLVSIIQNNQQLKLILIPHIPKITYHIKKNIGCIDFLKQMYDNNKNMLYNQTEIIKLIKLVCLTIQQQNKITSYYKSKLLDFFRYLIYCNGHAINYNQVQVLKIMQDDSYKNIIFIIDKNKIQELVKKYQETNSGQLTQNSNKIIKMSAQLTYIVTFFQVMVSLIDDKCKVNSGKLVKKFPFDTLSDLIKVSGKCWPLKRNIRAFLNRLYYYQSEIQTYSSTIQQKQIQNIINDLNFFIQIKCKGNVAQFQLLYFQNPVRFSYLQSYLYLNLEQNLFTLYQIVKNPKLVAQFKNFLHSAKNTSKIGPYNFIRICERLGWIRNYFASKKNIFTTSFIKFLLTELRKVIEEFDDNLYSEGMMFGGQRVPTKQEKDKSRKQLIQKILEGQIATFFIQNADQIRKQKPLVYQTPPKPIMPKDPKIQNRQKLIRKLTQILTRTRREYDNKDDEIDDKQSKLISALKLSQKVKQSFQVQYNQRLKMIIQINKQMILARKQKQKKQEQQRIKQNLMKLKDSSDSSNQIIKQNEISEKTSQEINAFSPKTQNVSQFDTLLEYVSSIIQINSISPDSLTPDLKIFFLNMIIGIIQQSNKTQKNQQQKLPIDQWESDHWCNSTKQIQIIQLKLKNGHLGKLIAEILKQNIIQNISLANSTLLCGIAYLLGGNQTTQKNLIQQISKINDNRVFRNLASLISKLGKIILKNIDQSSHKPVHSQDFQVNIIDNYDFYDERQKYCLRKNVIEVGSTNDVIYYQECIATYRRAFKFLQLLCQNNNVENKNFIRQQPDVMQSVNFITVATNQLRNLFEVMCKQIDTVPSFLLDFLIEVTQIPVERNQQALMNSSFFQDLCQMNTQLAKQNRLVDRGFDGNVQQLQQINSKCVQLILSNFEGNSKQTYQILDKTLDLKFLVIIIQNTLKKLEVKNKQELLLYIKKSLEGDPQNQNQKSKSKFSDDIMKIFDILLIFMKLKQKRGQESRLYESYKKFKSQSPERTKMLDFLQKNIINIQINDSKNQRQTIYFVKQPSYYSLSQNIRDYIMSVVKRDTHRDKIVSLIGYTTSIQQSLEYSYKLQKQQGIIQKNMNKCYKAAAIMSVIICIFMFSYYGVIIQYGQAQFTSNRIFRSIRFVLSLMQLSMSICYAYFWYRLKIWYQPEYQTKDQEKKNQDEGKAPKQVFYKNMSFYQLLLFVGVAFYGTFFDPTFFYIHIIDIFCQSPLLANIFKAIALTFIPVSIVSFMGALFVVVFCTVSFSNYTKDVYKQKQLRNPAQLCNGMFDCLLSLYVSGAIGQTMQDFETQRFIYDTMYAIFFGLLFGNIISGIMLDAFGNLREDNDNLLDDKSNNCYICNVKRQSLQKRKIKFKEHIKDKHFLWNYVFYVISLDGKQKTDLTGLQYQILNQYQKSDEDMKTDWIPNGGQDDYDPTDDVKNMITDVQKFNQDINKKLEELDLNVKEFNDKSAALMGE